MGIQLNRAPVETELLVTGHTPANKGSQILFGRSPDGKQYSVVVRNHVIARPVEIGEWWRLVGEWDSNPRYPNQIIAEHGEPLPVTGERLAEYILRHPKLRVGGGGTRIGKTTWEKAIAAAEGADELAELLDAEDKEALRALGLGRLTRNLETVLMHWQTLRGELEGVKLLARHGIGKRLSKRLIKHYGEQVPELLNTDCFKLLAFDRNTESLFRSCQQIADALEYPQGDPRRLQGAVDFVCNYRLDQHGHTAIAPETLLKALQRVFKDETLAKQAIEAARASGALKEAPGGLLQTRSVAFAEAELEHRFVAMLNMHTAEDEALLAQLPIKAEQVYAAAEFPLTVEQQAAIQLPFRSRLSVLTGGAGTGKTTVISSIVRLANSICINVYQAALSGQAADVMRRYNIDHDIDCLSRTIHWYVLPQEAVEEANQKLEAGEAPKEPPFEFDKDCLIILDESSMIDLALMGRLLRVLPESARILMVGDPNQIPPVGAGLVFHTLCHSERIPIARLTQPHRSAAETGIPAAVESISQGVPPTLPAFELGQPTPEHGVFFLPTEVDPSDPHSLARVIYQVADKLGHDHTQVITTHRAKSNKWGTIPASVHYINQYFQQQLTQGKAPAIKAWGLNVGDPVMVRKNVTDVSRMGFDLFNGNLGALVSAEAPYRFRFGEHERELDDSAIAQLGIQLGYGLTVHSFQGSATDCIIVAVTQSNLLERSLLYTALTRAKRICVFVGNPKVFETAVIAPPKWQQIHTGFGVDRYFPILP